LTPDAFQAERRRAPRRQPALGTVLDLDGRPARQGLVWNISTSGVSMLLPEPIDAGTALEAELVSTDAGGRLKVRIRIAHVRQLQNGDYFLGAQFDHPLSSDEMKPFVAAA
jgi:hypothetical protein